MLRGRDKHMVHKTIPSSRLEVAGAAWLAITHISGHQALLCIISVTWTWKWPSSCISCLQSLVNRLPYSLRFGISDWNIIQAVASHFFGGHFWKAHQYTFNLHSWLFFEEVPREDPEIQLIFVSRKVILLKGCFLLWVEPSLAVLVGFLFLFLFLVHREKGEWGRNNAENPGGNVRRNVYFHLQREVEIRLLEVRRL